MRFKFLKLKAQKSQKNRTILKYRFLNHNNKNKIIASKGGRFEFIYFFFLKKFLKKYISNITLKMNRRRVWFLCTANMPLTKKSKNSRMGSGKGYFLRWVMNLKKNSTILISWNIPSTLLYRVKNIWNLSLPFKVNVS